MYRLTDTSTVIRLDDGVSIPADVGNRDWRDYLAWVEAGGVAEPAIEPPLPTPREQIDALEREHMLPKATRKFMLSFMEATAIQQGAGQGLTPAQSLAALMAGNPGYAAVKSLDDQIEALEELL